MQEIANINSSISSALEAESSKYQVLQRFAKHKMAMFGLLLLFVIVTMVVLAPQITAFEPNDIDLAIRLQKPSWQHLMGTDELGRDVFARILDGGRISLFIGIMAMALGVGIGTVVGAVSGYFGGITDAAIMRFVDVLISFPTLFLLIFMASIFTTSVTTIIIVIGLLSWMRISRLVRGQFLSVKNAVYIEAAHIAGTGGLRIVTKHMLPNSIGPILVAATLNVSTAMLTESALSFLGLGIQPPQATWGTMLRFAQDQLNSAPWTAVYPGMMIFLVSIAINFIGDGLRDAYDPR